MACFLVGNKKKEALLSVWYLLSKTFELLVTLRVLTCKCTTTFINIYAQLAIHPCGGKIVRLHIFMTSLPFYNSDIVCFSHLFFFVLLLHFLLAPNEYFSSFACDLGMIRQMKNGPTYNPNAQKPFAPHMLAITFHDISRADFELWPFFSVTCFFFTQTFYMPISALDSSTPVHCCCCCCLGKLFLVLVCSLIYSLKFYLYYLYSATIPGEEHWHNFM